jgi:hypothetical protein
MKEPEPQTPAVSEDEQRFRRKMVLAIPVMTALGYFLGSANAGFDNVSGEAATIRVLASTAMGFAMGVAFMLVDWYERWETARTRAGRVSRHLHLPIQLATFGAAFFCMPVVLRYDHWLDGKITLNPFDLKVFKTAVVILLVAALVAAWNTFRAWRAERAQAE